MLIIFGQSVHLIHPIYIFTSLLVKIVVLVFRICIYFKQFWNASSFFFTKYCDNFYFKKVFDFFLIILDSVLKIFLLYITLIEIESQSYCRSKSWITRVYRNWFFDGTLTFYRKIKINTFLKKLHILIANIIRKTNA